MWPTLTLICSLLFVGGCARETSAPQSAIIILPGATDIRSERGFGENGTEYNVVGVNVREAINQVERDLRSERWTPLGQHHRNPPQSSSFVSGWACFPEESGIIFQWMSSWRDPNGNVVTYDFRSNESGAVTGSGDLEVRVSFESGVGGAIPAARGEPNFAISQECQRIKSSTLLQRTGTM